MICGDRSYEGKRETDETETQWEKRHKNRDENAQMAILKKTSHG